MEAGDEVLELEGKSGVSGGVLDMYGEDKATEDQLITPWAVSVARYFSNVHVYTYCCLIIYTCNAR